MNLVHIILSILILATIPSCDWWAPKSGWGFTLPGGVAENGLRAYEDFQCYRCHTIDGFARPNAETAYELSVPIGGEVSRIRTYGELVTSVINPSHKIARGYSKRGVVDGQSKMTNYNEIMTVAELVDLITFLQSRYKLREFTATDYPFYGY